MKKRFYGPIGKQIKQHLKLRGSLGCIYDSAKYDLDAFDQHLAKFFPRCKTISREMIMSYLDSVRHLAPKTQAQKITNLRQFCRFMFQINPKNYIPEKKIISHAEVQVKPHIFTEKEIIKLINQAKKFVSNTHCYLIPT